MERVRQPKLPQKLIPVMRDEETSRLLGTCKGREFAQLRDEAIIRLYCNMGARPTSCAASGSNVRPVGLRSAQVWLRSHSSSYTGAACPPEQRFFGTGTCFGGPGGGGAAPA